LAQREYTAATPELLGPSSTSNGAGLVATGASEITPAGERSTSANALVAASGRLHAAQPP
jgi:hypothetical protein